ncbi:antA/AntB antirepressor family protein [Vibrio sp. Isolate25]|uniref:antA/AntB antirepressor family protein n=1 Tax=Vibrio sp. Isolate25 TaxID=2908535 RepID=UPI001EFD653C|nr:antA/AntB antirepressor family protein [Vibrio sp. Isolate25]MCG9597040.1 antA/AntB antirepressor family protein [Vibrio sp. Isolate25]
MNTKKSPIQIEVFESTIDGVVKRCVDARNLHSNLGNATAFTLWMTRKIEDIGFVEKKDFFSNLKKNDEKGRPSTEYTITVEMAKHLCMLEKSDIGYQMREYFIACEQKLIEVNELSVNQFSTLYKDLQRAMKELKTTGDKFEVEIQKEVIERLCLKMKLPQPPLSWLGQKKNDDE